jgi:two-component system, OmpR family, KDP operon response regulator KdpE
MTDNTTRVLVVDDEQAIRRYLRASLGAHGYELFEASTGREALEMVPIARPDMVILDLCLPDLDGVDVTRSLREWSQMPIIILSVRSQESDKVAALDAGADDYITKPFGASELLARIRVALRHAAPGETSSVFSTGDLAVDLARRSVQFRQCPIQLTPTEYDILKLFIRNADRVLTHRQIIKEVWGGLSYEDELHLLRVNISNLRRKLESDPAKPRYIVTEPGVGYRLRTS